jgi:hypothetical protein
MSIVRNTTQRFGYWIGFRLQVRRGRHLLLGPLERANLSLNQKDVSFRSPEDGIKSSFRKVVFSRIPGDGQSLSEHNGLRTLL